MRTVGIDLGTTNSVVAVAGGDGGGGAGGAAKVLAGPAGEDPIVPSVVWLDGGGRTIVGVVAKEQQQLGNKSVASFFKRQMGDDAARFVAADGREYTPVQLSAEVLKRLKADAEHALGGPVGDAVITVPAYFYDPQRKATVAAAKLAGLNVIQLINEPTAAAIAFGVGAGAGQDGHVLVYDLGGGTFDVTLLKVSGSDIRVLTSDGDAELGGKDWDQRILTFLASSFREEHGVDPLADAVAIGDLYVAAEDAKKALSARQSTTVRITHAGEESAYEYTRAAFEEQTADLLARTLNLVDGVLARKDLKPAQIDRVLLVGGSTRMPMVKAALERHFGRPPSAGVHPDHAVALGASLCAAAHAKAAAAAPRFMLAGRPAVKATADLMLASGQRVSDVAPHSLGMIAVNADNTAYVNAIVLAKDSPIPQSYKRPFSHRTRPNDDNLFEVFITQGEQDEPGAVKYLGRYVIPKVLHAQNGLAVVDIDYSYDRGGSLVVAASAGGAPLEVRVEPLPTDVPERFLRPPPKPVRMHVTVYLSFDLSGSMSGDPLDEAKRAAAQFLTQMDLAHTSVGIIGHADRAEVMLPASQKASAIGKAIDRLAVDTVGIGNGQHPFDEAAKVLKRVTGPRFVIALADGVWSDQSQAIASAKRLHDNGIEVIAIGFGGADTKFLKQIASCDQGSFFTSLHGLVDTFSTIATVITQTGGDTSAPTGGGGGPASSAGAGGGTGGGGGGGFWGLLGSKR